MDAKLADTDSPGLSVPPRPVRVLMRLAPWLSLALSVAGAAWMKRDSDAAALVAGGVAGSSIAVSALLWARRSRRMQKAGRLGKAMNLAGVLATQSLAQLPLFFSAPFYLLAFAHTPAQTLFLGVFAAAVLAVTWDPLAYHLLPHDYYGAPLVAFCSFVGLRAALPMLGVPAAWSLALALAAIVVLTVWDLRLRWPGETWRRRLGAALGLLFALLVLAPTMPAAPLRLVKAGMGRDVLDRQLHGEASEFEAGGTLYCWTAVFSPRETDAVVLHHWSRDGEHLAELDLPVRGGRRGGFRTWTRVHAVRPGEYRCEVRNLLGQVLGAAIARVR